MSELNKADLEYNNLINKINKEGEWDYGELVRGVYDSDGEPAYTKSIFGHSVKFENNSIPLITSKKVFVKTAVKEAWLFWVLQTVKEDDFKENNVNIWNQWFKNGSLGRSYAYQFESHRHVKKDIVKVNRVTKEKHKELKDIKVSELKTPNFNISDQYIGTTIRSKNYGEFTILDVDSSQDKKKYIIQFKDTGFITSKFITDINNGEVKDLYVRNVCGVGYRGNYTSVNNYKKRELDKLYTVWRSMISRCYGTTDRKSYQGKDVFVEERWHSFENFLRDIRYTPQFFLAKENGFKGYELDKDYKGSNCYSKDSVVWLSTYENKLYRDYIKAFYAIDSHGNRELFISQKECADKLGLSNPSPINGCLNKKPNRKSSKGYTFEYLNDDCLYRYELSKNQVVELLINIKKNPQSRRLMTSFWNDADVDKKSLQECAWSTQYNIKGSYMDSLLIQRSVDTGLGLPFNWIQYWVLGNLIAHVNGYEYRDFTHQMGNIHYYNRHEESLLNQVNLKTFKTPMIHINNEVKDFFDFTPDDVIIDYYECGKYINLEVAV